MILAIVGSRGITDYSLIVNALQKHSPAEIITGGAVGVDELAANYANENGIELTVYQPDYSKFGKQATHIRNQKIVDHCTHLIAFWDGRSAGTKSSIEKAKKKNKEVTIVLVK